MTTHNQDLPERGMSVDQERLFRTALASKDYLRLEIESMDRGLKPYSLTKSIMTLYLHKQLIYLKDLPVDLQAQINAHYKKQPNLTREETEGNVT